jgi:hypothetical protein
MDNLRRFETVRDYNVFNNNETLHPLVSVVDLSKAAPRQGSRMYFGFYTIFLKDVKCGDLVYGRHVYDYQEGTLVFLAPGQVAGVNSNGETYQPKGYALIFHADLLPGTFWDVIFRIIVFLAISQMKHCISPKEKEPLYSIVFQKLNMNWNMRSTSIVKL